MSSKASASSTADKDGDWKKTAKTLQAIEYLAQAVEEKHGGDKY